MGCTGCRTQSARVRISLSTILTILFLQTIVSLAIWWLQSGTGCCRVPERHLAVEIQERSVLFTPPATTINGLSLPKLSGCDEFRTDRLQFRRILSKGFVKEVWLATWRGRTVVVKRPVAVSPRAEYDSNAGQPFFGDGLKLPKLLYAGISGRLCGYTHTHTPIEG